MRPLFFVFALTLSLTSEARVFDFKNEKVSAYLRGIYGTTNLGDQAYSQSGGAGLTFSDSSKFFYSGEIGFAFMLNRAVMRLGIELIRPQSFKGIQARSSDGILQYSLDSSVVGGLGIFGLDFLFAQTQKSRFFVTLGGGYGLMTLKNDYAFTSDGTTTYSVPNYTEEGSSYNSMWQGGLGWEAVMSDSVTFRLDTGYRSFVVTGLKHERPGQTLIGTVATGDTMKNQDGTDRKLDLSGFWVGAGFHFYINFL